MALLPELMRAWRCARDPRLAAALAPFNFPAGGPIWGVGGIEISGAHYQPMPEGDGALIVSASRRLRIVDLVACRLKDRRIATRLGTAAVLGEDWLDLARREGMRLPLFSDPLRWLAAGQRGAVILDWYLVPALLDGVPAIGCDSPALARRVHTLTRRLAAPPTLHLWPKRSPAHAA